MLSLLAACVLTTSGSALAAAPEALLIAPAVSHEGYRAVAAPVDFGEVGAALGATRRFDPTKLRASVVIGGRETPLACQFEPAAGPAGPGKGTVSVLLPPKALPESVRLTWGGKAPVPTAEARVEVQRNGSEIVVRNEHYAVTHDPAKMGGLPSRIEFVKTGKTFDSFALNDRVYEKGVGGFSLRYDPAPEVTVVAEGPVYAAVRVKARYMQGDKQPASRPEATYEFRYYAGSSMISVRARVTQQTPFAWPEHHFLELNFPDQSFTAWAGGEPLKEGKFEVTEKGWSSGQWGALIDGQNLLGMMGCGSVKFYDGRGGYGTYLHGPWTDWSSTEREFQATLWVGDSPAGPAVLQQAAKSASPQSVAYVTVPPLLDALKSARGQCSQTPGAAGARATWVVDRVGQLAHEKGLLTKGLALAKELSSVLSKRTGADPVKWFCSQSEQLRSLDDGKLLAAFDAKQLRLVSLYDLGQRRELLASAPPPPLWELALRAEGSSQRLSADAAGLHRSLSLSAAGEAATLGWRLDGEPGPLAIECKARLAQGALLLTLAVKNTSATWALTEITFPQVEFGALGGSAEDDTVVTSRGSGELRKAPLLNAYRFSGLYPSGWSSMQFAAYYDPKGGAYFAAEDPYASTKDLQVETVSDRPALAMRVRWPAPDSGVPGNDWETPGHAALRLTGGHWFDAAQLYKVWARHSAKWWPADESRPDTPDWFKDVAMWACTGGAPSECVEKVKKLAEYVDVPTAFHWYSWHKIPFDVEYPHYFPTKDGMAEGVKELQAAGVRVMPYINGRLWDSANDDFKNEAIKYCTKSEKGEPYIEEYSSGAKLSPMCPTTPFWQHKVQEIVGRLTGPEVGVDSVYLDQIAAASPRLCYDKSHGHPLSGGHWWTTDGYWPMLTELRKQLTERAPGKALTSECNAESYTNRLDGLLTWHFQYQDQIPLFAAVYGGKIQLFSRAYKGDDQVAHRMKAGQSLVFGEQIGWLNPDLVLKNKETGEFIREMARLRYELRDFLARGEMARPPRVEGDVPDVTADWAWSGEWPITTSALQTGAWQATDGRIAFLFVNVSEAPVKAKWAFRSSDYGFPADARFVVVDLQEKTPRNEGAAFARVLDLAPRSTTVFIVKSTNH